MPAKSALSWGDQDLRTVKSPEELPEIFNFAAALLDRHLAEGRGSRVALLGPAGTLTYAELVRLANQAGNALQELGVERENRVLLLLRDSPEFIATYLGAMKIGAVPVALNTFARPSEYEFYVRHSRAKVVVGEAEFLAPLESLLRRYPLRGILSVRGDAFAGAHPFQPMLAAQSPELDPAPTVRDDMSHWVYTSGSTGEPKAAVHLHKNTMFCVEPYVRHVVRMTPDDINFSVSRLFFSYGLTNSMFMPLWVGGGSLLMPMRPEPDRIFEFIEQYRPTLFFCVPTGYGRLLRENPDPKKLASLRLCVSAGEALPGSMYQEWKARTGLQILDGVGSTEFGYIFLSNRPDDVKLDSSGKVLPEHRYRLVDADGKDVEGEGAGELWISSPSIAAFYWTNHERSRKTFVGEWLRTGDQYVRDAAGYLSYQGRSDDLFKSGGIWVSPIQVESVLISHPAVAEASVV
ncbi:MAG TPA: benzoate-CoA ligase family protein, partial [Terriglobia bacterium]|nr:benzoate-CoA ligase family protein [Terriglobia bacterium]